MSILLELLWALLACAAFGVACGLRLRRGKLIFAALGGAVAWGVFRLCGLAIESDIVCYFFATVVISAYSELMARRFSAPISVYLAISLIPLVPGSGIYNTMLQFISGNTAQAVEAGIHTLGIAGALAIGIVTVSSTVRIFTHRPIRTDLACKKK